MDMQVHVEMLVSSARRDLEELGRLVRQPNVAPLLVAEIDNLREIDCHLMFLRSAVELAGA